MSGANVLFLVVWFASTLAIAVAAFLYGWAWRDEHTPHPATRSVVAAVLETAAEERPRIQVWLGGDWRVPVREYELPHFLCRGACRHIWDAPSRRWI